MFILWLQNGTSGSDDLADICNSLVDMVCPPEASDQVEECPNDAVPSVEGKAKNSEENDNLDVKEVQDRMAVDEAGEDTVEECDFSSEVVKLTASAACLGSMHNFSTSDLPWPYYFISTRDCFTYQLLPIKTKVGIYLLIMLQFSQPVVCVVKGQVLMIHLISLQFLDLVWCSKLRFKD